MTSDPSIASSPLGKASAYVDQYDPALLFPIDRGTQRAALGLHAGKLPFFGADLWTAFEVSWLNSKGKPQVALAHITVPCESPNIIESKSLKLYLNSFNNSRFDSVDDVRAKVRADLSEALWRNGERHGTVGLKFILPEMFAAERVEELQGVNLDRLDIECTASVPTPSLLSADSSQVPVTEMLTSRLLKSNCPVTGQPDWGSVQVSYSGHPIDQAGLLAYVVSYRNHNDFHEHCVERMFLDILEACRPHKLAILARYTRRGGLDINPFRASWPQALPANHRSARQ